MVDLTRDEAFNFLGFNFRRVKTRRGEVGSALHAEDKGTNGSTQQTQGSIPGSYLAAGGSGDIPDKPDSTGMGELLPDWTLQ